MSRRTLLLAAVVTLVVAASPSRARANGYTEEFLGWSRDHSFFVVTAAGTDGMAFPLYCLGRPGATPPSWPTAIPPPADGDDRGCTAPFPDNAPIPDPPPLVAAARAVVVAPKLARTGPHGETVAVKAVADKTIIEVDVSRSRAIIGRAFFELRNDHGPVPDDVTAAWRDDGLAVAVTAGYVPAPDPPPGFGPPSYVVIIPLDGTAANAMRPPTVREQSSALNIAGMKLLGAHQLEAAQAKFVEASAADPSYSIPLYNLASVASLRHDSSAAVAALLHVVDLAAGDPEAQRAVVHGKTDHDLDFIASQSPYVTKLLGRPRVAGDDWCIAAEQRARDINRVNLDGLADAAGTAIDATARVGVPVGKDAELACFVRAGRSELTITLHVAVTPKAGAERIYTVAWKIAPDGSFDADVVPDDAHTRTLGLGSLDRFVKTSHVIAGS